MPNNLLRLIRLLQILLLLFRQCLPSRLKRLIHPLYTAKANDRARNTLVDPGQRNMAHLPPPFIGDFLHAANDL